MASPSRCLVALSEFRSSLESTHTRIHSSGCICNFDTRPKIALDRILSCVPDWQKLESSFEKYGLSSEKSTVQSSRQHFVSVCTHAAQALRSKKRLVLIPETHQSTRAVVQASRTAVASVADPKPATSGLD